MPQIEAAEFYRQLDEGQFAPIYFIYGEEPYLLRQSLERIRAYVLQPETIDFNYNQYFAGQAEVDLVRDAVEQLPMMAARRLVILREAQGLTDSEWAQLETVIQTPVDSTVFVVTADKIDKRKKAFRTLMEKASTVEFKKPYDNQIPGWIRYIASQMGLQLSDEAVHLVHKLVGHHLSEIEAELTKLRDFVGDGRRAEIADVAAVVSRRREESVFDLCRAIGENNRIQALEHLVYLLDQGQNEVGIVALVARHLRLLMALKRGQEDGLYGAKLANAAQVPPYFLDQYLEQTKVWTLRHLEKSLAVLAETDKALKSSPLSSHIWLENMILRLSATSVGFTRVPASVGR